MSDTYRETVRHLPVTHPGEADHRSPARFLLWTARGQWLTLLGGMAFGVTWMIAQALTPALIGRAIDQGVAGGDLDALGRTALWMLLLGSVQAVSAIMRHRFAVTNWLIAAYRTVQLVVRHVVRVGVDLPRRMPTGEVVTIATADMAQIGRVMDVVPRFTGSVVSFVVVAVIVLGTSVPLGLLVLVGVPVLTATIGPLLHPLQRRAGRVRGLAAELSTMATDIVAGLRVLRGLGGESLFAARYHRASQRVRRAGVRLAEVASLTDALQVLLPGVFVVVVVWAGARAAVAGRLSPGELVAFYGYTAFLTIPLRTVTEFADKLVRALVSARRICHLLALGPPVTSADRDSFSENRFDVAGLATADLTDDRSGVRARAGRLTAVVPADPDAGTHLADRLSLLGTAPGEDVQLGGVPLCTLSRTALRRTVVLCDPDSMLFAGQVADVLDVRQRATEGDLRQALHVAAALDIVDSLPDGLAAPVDERGRTFSGGQRQRLALARAVLADPPVLVLVEPTCAVDAHTEARIARRLHAHRQGRTTVVVTTSPLILEVADEVAFLEGGRVVAVGRHEELLVSSAAYHAVVDRSVGENAGEQSGQHGGHPSDAADRPIGEGAA